MSVFRKAKFDKLVGEENFQPNITEAIKVAMNEK